MRRVSCTLVADSLISDIADVDRAIEVVLQPDPAAEAVAGQIKFGACSGNVSRNVSVARFR